MSYREENGQVSGAVTYEQCPDGGGPRRCKCGRCARCNNKKHTAIHGPVNGGGPGSKPYDHEFVPQRNASR
jgi:hypothetical protein